MPTCSYNGIEFTPLTIVSLQQESVYTEDRTDYLYTHFVVELTALINKKEMSYGAGTGLESPPAALDQFPADTLVAIRHALLQPNRPLELTIFGDVILKSPPERYAAGAGDFATDCKNGPIPLEFSVTRFDGGRTFVVRWKVETWLRECQAGSEQEQVLLSNRFTQSDDVDGDSFLTTRTTSGTAHFAVNILNDAGLVADAFRSLCVPLPPLGFRRVAIHFLADPARNALRYHVVDREQMHDVGETDPRLGGSGITGTPEVTYSVTTTAAPGGIAVPLAIAQVAVRVRGSRLSSLWRLTQECVLIATRKLPLGQPDKGFVRQLAIVQDVTNKSVTFTAAMELVPLPAPRIGLNDEGLQVEDPFQSDLKAGRNPSPPHGDGTRGTFNGELLVAALTTACTDVAAPPHNAAAPDEVDGANDEQGPEPVVVVNFGQVLPEQPTHVSDEGLGKAYTAYSVEMTHEKDEHVLPCPVAGPAGTPQAFLTLAAPTSRRIITGTAECVGQIPRLPHPFPLDPNLVLLRQHVTPPAPTTNPTTDAVVWHIAFRFEYGLRNPLGAGDELPMGALPWLDRSYTQNVIPASAWRNGILNAAS